jgi:hypothetical protein
MLKNKTYVLLCAPELVLASDRICGFSHDNLQLLSKIFLHFTSLAMVGVLVGGNNDVVPTRLIVHSLTLHSPITHVSV